MVTYARQVRLLCSLLAALVPLVMFASPSSSDEETRASGGNPLPVVGSYAHLKQLLAKEWEYHRTLRMDYAVENGAVFKAGAPQAAVPAAGTAPADAVYSATNVQVEGVDEADIVKTDGTYLYQARQEEVVITQAYPVQEMKIVSRLPFQGEQFTPQELYVDDNYLVVIGESHPAVYDAAQADYFVPVTTKAVLYDIHDKTAPRQLREVEIEGSYLTSRKIGSSLYLISSRSINLYGVMQAETELPPPVYRDSLFEQTFKGIGYQEIRYFPDNVRPNYLLVAGLNLDQPRQHLDVSAYLGSGEHVYASAANLYVAVSRNEVTPAAAKRVPFVGPVPANQSTTVYKFALTNGHVAYKGSGRVPGTVLNQFSMDEQNGFLRIATTVGNIWRNDEATSKNNMYVLDASLRTVGKLENIAPGEKIYAVRFMGSRAYMVTFKKVDPLFVIDLQDPKAPRILGKLKIPGYSDYLHPYDENHLIGFGKDTTEVKDTAYYQGLKVALFDVSDVAHPKEMFKEVIGDRGTDSELLRNHKALLFSKEKNLLAFPVTLMEKDKQVRNGNSLEYGSFTFQGAYVYSLDLAHGFRLRARITHLDPEVPLQAGDAWYRSENNVERILYIRNMLYTISDTTIKAHELTTLREAGVLAIPSRQ
ncbi:hypothetical protein G3578_20295 [Brevibacillus sp. SYP-B805]|uniref:beta-propeller domain-containing protein n=1 Tax=Brevibacillus sp. SYP-B805 TaxID=1578199 RepID=UPI0013EC1351|nr:beta-propeller domain-containing protein [Brevibacillus sp. SYP-B805]NGQ97481.1 hypothetical protein [Brevibacillus sp. SYP-B805]